MRNKIFMFLFLFAALYIVFQYMNAKKADKFYTERVASLEAEVEKLQTKIDTLQLDKENLFQQNRDLSYFSLKENDAANSFFTRQGLDVEEISAKVVDEIISRNKATEDNNLIPFEGMEGLMRVNKIHILNHRWVIADFTDGIYWGELLLKYYINDDGKVELETFESFLYPGRR